ncbi:MAG: DegV family EDD domain-containing protein, partial [Lachnospiraceae bacterium]|nr:DegV family EDD domain-containing protein [Lachnospiraceae bacterium]
MAVRIITDSTVDVAKQYKDQFVVVPLTVTFGETEYIDGVTLDKMEFYKRLEGSPVLPRTSQATPDAFAKAFRELQEKGEEAVVITVTSRLSGTYQSARIAAEDFPNIRVVDSRNVSIGSGVLAEYALQCAEKGMELEELT